MGHVPPFLLMTLLACISKIIVYAAPFLVISEATFNEIYINRTIKVAPAI